jgi:hypothetical protein
MADLRTNTSESVLTRLVLSMLELRSWPSSLVTHDNPLHLAAIPSLDQHSPARLQATTRSVLPGIDTPRDIHSMAQEGLISGCTFSYRMHHHEAVVVVKLFLLDPWHSRLQIFFTHACHEAIIDKLLFLNLWHWYSRLQAFCTVD